MSNGPYTGYLGYCDDGTCQGFFNEADKAWMACGWPDGYNDGDPVVITFAELVHHDSCCMEQSTDTYVVETITKVTGIPLTVQSAMQTTSGFGAFIGEQSYRPPNPQANTYWFSVHDRASLNQVASATTTNYLEIPKEIASYLGNKQFLLLVSSFALSTLKVPQGNLYAALLANGAGSGLRRLEQINNQLGCGEFGWVGYVLVSAMGGGPSFEDTSINWSTGAGPVVTLQLVMKDGLYTPRSL
jgi:hypothetical protein